MSLTNINGKNYLRFDVTANRVTIGNETGGVLYFANAFDATGLDSTTWPYSSGAAIVSSVKMAYFVDPTSQLPVYSQIAYSPPTSEASWDNYRVAYDFTKLPMVTLGT